MAAQAEPAQGDWLLVDDALEGRLLWNDDDSHVGTPYKVAVEGRMLTWSELGRALEAYEGWRFRIELADRADDLRPDADVVALQFFDADEAAPERAAIATIDEILVAFLADQRERLAPRTYGRYDEIVDLLRPVSTTTGTRSSTKSNKLGWMPPRRVTRRHLSTCSDPTSSFPG